MSNIDELRHLKARLKKIRQLLGYWSGDPSYPGLAFNASFGSNHQAKYDTYLGEGKRIVARIEELTGTRPKLVDRKASLTVIDLSVNSQSSRPDPRGRRWFTEAEDSVIRDLYPTKPASAIAERLGRSAIQIKKRAEILGCRATNRGLTAVITPEDAAYLKDTYGKIPTRNIAVALNRSVRNVHNQAAKFKLKHPNATVCEAAAQQEFNECQLRLRDQLVADYRYIVPRLARRVGLNYRYYDFEELESAGLVAMVKAANSFVHRNYHQDPTRAFRAYAIVSVRRHATVIARRRQHVSLDQERDDGGRLCDILQCGSCCEPVTYAWLREEHPELAHQGDIFA